MSITQSEVSECKRLNNGWYRIILRNLGSSQHVDIPKICPYCGASASKSTEARAMSTWDRLAESRILFGPLIRALTLAYAKKFDMYLCEECDIAVKKLVRINFLILAVMVLAALALVLIEIYLSKQPFSDTSQGIAFGVFLAFTMLIFIAIYIVQSRIKYRLGFSIEKGRNTISFVIRDKNWLTALVRSLGYDDAGIHNIIERKREAEQEVNGMQIEDRPPEKMTWVCTCGEINIKSAPECRACGKERADVKD